MRKLFFTVIILFLSLGQVWAETRTFDGSTKFYVMNYKPSGLGGSTLWAISDDCKFYFDLVDGSANHHWYEATLVSGSGAYSEGAIYSITPDAGTYSYFIMTRGKGKSFGDATNQTGNIGFHSDASYNLVNGGYDKDGTGTTWGKVTPKSVTSDGTGVLYFNGSPSSATWWKDYGADRQSAFFYNNTSGKFTTTSVLVSGNYYKVTVPEGTWTGVILTRHNAGTTTPSWDNKCNQTQDIPLVEGKNYLSNFGEAPGTYTWEDFIPTGTTVLNGTMNDWSLITAKAFTDGELEIDLPARKTMSFKIVEGNNGSGTWYGLTDANCILSDMTDWGFSSSGTNTRINTAGQGTYTFAYNASHQLSVTYPEVTHPNADYVYLIKYDWSSWRIHFEQSSTTYGIAKTTWTGQELTVASGTITDTYDYTAPGEEDAQTYFYYAVGDYPKFNFNDNTNNGNQTGDQTPSPGQYMYHDGSSWGWHTFSFNVEEHNDGGRIWEDSVDSYTFGVGATLPTNVTKLGCDFGGWYDNSSFEGEPVTAITTTDTGNKEYYAKWTSIAQTYPIAEHPEFLAAQEGDIIAVTVTGVHTSAAIYLQYTNGTTITNRSLSEAGTYTFQLDAAAAAGIRTNGLLVTGQNFTYSDVDILYRKTIWEGEVDATDDWEQSDAISNELFAGLQAGDFLGVTVNKINENKDSWHTYAIRAEWRTNIISHDMSDTDVGIDILTDELVDSLQNKTIILVSSYLSCTAIHTYTHTRVYDVTLNTDDGSIWDGDVTSYTFGEGATLPTNVTKWGYDFAGWYDNPGLEGDPVTAITTSDTGNKDYYAKWTSIAQTYPIAEHPEFLAAQEGDIIAVTVTGVHTSAAIYLQYTNGTPITNRSISSTGTYTFQLSADAATEISTNGLLVTGQNFTFSDVDILYRKTIWTGSLSDNTGWAETAVEKSIFSGLSGGDFLGFNISAINDGETWHQYAIRADDDNVLAGSCTETEIAIHQLSAADITALTDSDKIDIVAQYLDISNLYSYTDTRVYTVTLNTDEGSIWDGNVTSYTFGEGVVLPTNVTKWNHNFGGWYDNSSFEGEPVTAITTTDTGNKDYYAKWTSIIQEYPIASHPQFIAAQEGDIIVVNVTSTQASSTIYLYPLGSATDFEHRDISSTGKHIFQLSAAAAASLRTYGLLVTGQNFTFDDVQIRYRKTIWTGTLSAEDNWKVADVDKFIFSGLSGGDFLGFDVSKINTGSYHQYAIRANGETVLDGSRTDAGVGVHELSAANVTALQNATTADIVAQYLEIAHLYAYSGIFVIYRTGDAPDGGIETFEGGTIDSPIEYRMKVHTLDQWYSLYLPFTVDAIKVIEDGVYYDIQPYYRPEVGGTLYQGHYFIRTPAKTTDFEIANFSEWRDPDTWEFTPSGNTPYVIRWHDSYFLNKYISFFGHTDAAIPETMTERARPTKDSVVNVYGNDAMVNGSVVDGYTLVADYGNGAWLREETIGNSRTVLPFECYLRANDKTTPIFKALQRTDITTGIDQITNDKSPMTNKKLINGQLIIIRDNKMYNVMGMEVAQ